MEITKVQISLHKNPDSKVRAFCSIVFDDVFIVKRLVIIQNASGEHFVNMPNWMHNGEQINVAFPLNDAFRQYIENRVLDEYEIILNKIANGSHHANSGEERLG